MENTKTKNKQMSMLGRSKRIAVTERRSVPKIQSWSLIRWHAKGEKGIGLV